MDIDLDKLLEEKDEYDDFVEKFKHKRTTDDCFTLPEVYEKVKKWVFDHYELSEGTEVVRPFWPGADYKAVTYPEGCVVIDNPPFSIIAEIERYYLENKIRFFLFAPGLTIFKPYKGLKYVFIDAEIVYENGERVNTSFVTNMGDWLIETAPELEQALRKPRKEKPLYGWPDELLTAAMVQAIAKARVLLQVDEKHAHFVRKLDAGGKGIYGCGMLLSRQATAEKLAAEKLAAEKLAAEKLAAETRKRHRFELSQRELEIVRKLGE